MSGVGGVLVGFGFDASGGGTVIEVPVQIVSGAMILHGGISSSLGYAHLMEGRKGGGKTGGKISKDALASGRQRIEKIRGELDQLRSKPNKTPADKAAISAKTAELKRAIDRLRKSEDYARVGQH